MFDIILYKFPKKQNSTAYPATETTAPKKTFSCLMRTACSISAPVIQIEDTSEISNYNYAYIPSFNRYYFVNNIVCDMPVWILYLRVDVLASFNASIMASSQYISRSASAYSANIADSFYPTVAKVPSAFSSFAKVNLTELVYRQDDVLSTWVPVTYFDVKNKNGCVVVGVLSGGQTGVTYYGFSVPVFRDFLNKAFTLIPSTSSSADDLTKQALFNSLQYITSARWFPTLPLINNTGGTTDTISLGSQNFQLSSGNLAYIMNEYNIEKFKFYIDLPQHPKASTRQYMKLSPYSKYNLFFQPFGDIPLDSLKLYGASGIDVYWTTDYTSGATSIRIYRHDDNGLIYNDITSLGVPLPLSEVVYDTTASFGLSALQFIKDMAPAASSRYTLADYKKWTGGNIAEKIGEILHKGLPGQKYSELKPISSESTDNVNMIDGMMDAIASTFGQVSVKGNAGSYLAYNMGKPYIYAWFIDQVDYDDARFGRPLKEIRTLNTLSGFCLCENANIGTFLGTTMPNEQEVKEILRLLNSGIYIEARW